MSGDARQPTLGERRMRVNFNPSGESIVDEFKQDCAALIDKLNDWQPPADALPAEVGRLKALAFTAFEEAGMFAVKALTTGAD